MTYIHVDTEASISMWNGLKEIQIQSASEFVSVNIIIHVTNCHLFCFRVVLVSHDEIVTCCVDQECADECKSESPLKFFLKIFFCVV